MTDSLLSQHDALLVDLDGTLYRGNIAIPNAAKILGTARERGATLRFVTNNASSVPEDIAEKLTRFGIAVGLAEISSSMQVAARLLAKQLSQGDLVLVIGTAALADEVARVGLRTTTFMSDEVKAVVQGYSSETNWKMLAEGSLAINAGALWVACNIDATLPSERGLLPGNGALVAALEEATGRKPMVVGKPQPQLFIEATEAANAQKPLVIGDRIDTDIAGAVAAGYASMLVLSGATDAGMLLTAEESHRPSYVANSIKDLDQPADQLSIGAKPGWRVDVAQGELRISGDGSANAHALLRTLCEVVWRTGTTSLVAEDSGTAAALTELKLTFVG